MFDKYLLGKNIREARERVGFTQSALAEKLFVSFQAVSAWERGITPPEIENICRLSEIFGVPVDELLFSDNDREKLFVGIDGGGTKTELVLFTVSGEVIKKLKLSGGNPNDIGIEACEKLLSDGLEKLCGGGYKPVGAFVGIAGGESSGGASKIVSTLKKRFPGVKLELGGDFLNVLSCADDPNNAMGLICGTGITVFTRKAQGQTGKVERIGGWGFLFDEGGSGYNIGNDALRHALLCADGLCERTLLCEYVENEIGDIKKALGAIYTEGLPKVASFSSTVFKAFSDGDTTANQILVRNALCTAKLINNAVKKYNYAGVITACGSLIANPIYADLVQKECTCKISVPDIPPVYGACVECLLRNGIKPEVPFTERFRQSYGKSTN